MGVLNLTPDSFYDGGKYNTPDKALGRVEQMVSCGADIIDLGGESTRPGSEPVSAEEELKRVLPVIRKIKSSFDIPLSVDTTKSEVASAALEEGASIINDISGLRFDVRMAGVAAEYGAGIILMHTPSRPRDMQSHTDYESLLDNIADYLSESADIALEAGVSRESIVIDPGFGFGKTAEQNLELLGKLNRLTGLGYPVMIGTSNKSFIGKTLDCGIEERLEGTAATVAIGIMNGASIVRVHDTKQMKRVCRMADAVLRAN